MRAMIGCTLRSAVAPVLLVGFCLCGPLAACSSPDVALRLAANRGNAEAQASLGLMYAEGEGVPQDHDEAVRWFRLGADRGDAGAQNSLGGMYANGQSVAQDDVEALRWYRLSADQGHATARYNVQGIEARMTSEQIAEAERLARGWKPTPAKGRIGAEHP